MSSVSFRGSYIEVMPYFDVSVLLHSNVSIPEMSTKSFISGFITHLTEITNVISV